MFDAIEEATLVAKCQLEDPRRLEVRPGRIGKAAGRRGKDFVAAVLVVGEQPHPFVDRLQEADFFGAMVLVLFAVGVCLANRNDAISTARRDR